MDSETHRTARPKKQLEIEHLPVGESVARVHRVDLAFGLTDEEKSAHTARVRGTLDSQVNRTRRKFPGRQFTVESILAPTAQSAALIFIAVATRTN